MNNQFILNYEIADKLYLNITNICSNQCRFCIRNTTGGIGYNLWLEREPTSEEILMSIQNPEQYSEIVFCGYGEPLSRLDVVKEVATELKRRGARSIRVNTNGQANLLYSRNVVPELKGLVDTMSISLNAQNASVYNDLCKPLNGEDAYYSLLNFTRQCVGIIPRVVLSVVEWPGVDVEACKKIAEDLKVEFRLRKPTE